MLEVYLLGINRDLSHYECDLLLQLTSAEKREKIGRFHRFEDAQRALLGDHLIRRIVAEKLGLLNNEICFDVNGYGKPFLNAYPDFQFNRSHSGNYVTCAVSDSPVGIDVEEIKPIDLKITKRFFTEDEGGYVFSHTGVARHKAFYRVWTMKESYIKYVGKGLSIPLQSFSVLGASDISFYQVFEDEKAVCHVCTEKSRQPPIFELSVDDMLSWIKNGIYPSMYNDLCHLLK